MEINAERTMELEGCNGLRRKAHGCRRQQGEGEEDEEEEAAIDGGEEKNRKIGFVGI